MKFAIYAMVYLGSALMVFNIIGFVRFAVKAAKKMRGTKNTILYIPIILLVMFLLGYLAVGIIGKPDLIVSGILFGGSIFVFVMYIFLDRITKHLTEREQLEAKLMAAQESQRAKTEFLSGVSHEMRTPLNVILGLDTMVLKDDTLSPETKDRVEKIGSSAKHLLSLINNILDMNSMETGEFTVKNEEFFLKDALDQINAIAETRCAQKGLEYRFDVQPQTGGYFVGDDMRIKQILLSLLDNAVKYTDKGAVSLCAESIKDGQDKELLRFTVKDTGVGIDAEFLPKIFEVFTKEDTSTTSSHGGSGLGLAVTKNIVDKLGGTITAQSKKNEGSSFTVTLPLVRVYKEDAPEQDVSLEGKRILIVEDIAENAEIAADLLELEGAESNHAENGLIAVNMFRDSEPEYYDAILMDLRMPVMDGITATKEIRKLERDDSKTVPIIALTANAFESDIRDTLEAGMDIHLAKPADSDKLYAAIKKAIAKNAAAKENKS